MSNEVQQQNYLDIKVIPAVGHITYRTTRRDFHRNRPNSGISGETLDAPKTEIALLESFNFSFNKTPTGVVKINDTNINSPIGAEFAELNPLTIVSIGDSETKEIISTGFYSPEIAFIGMSPIVFIARDANLLKNTSSLVVDTFTIDLVPFQNGTETFEEVLDVINIDLKKYVEKAMPCAKKDLARIQRREKILTQILDKVHMQMCQIAGREYATLP